MSTAGKFLRETVVGFVHWCPGCGGSHSIPTKERQSNGAIWSFDGNFERPTFSPSVNISWGKQADPSGDWPEGGRCHYFIRDGKIQFCGDSTHELRGKTVDLPVWPKAPGTYGGIIEESDQ